MIRPALLAWAARDLARRPGRALLDGLALALLTAVVATVLLLVESWTAAAGRLVDAGPSLVVRAVTPRGWEPILVSHATALEAVPGVTSVRPRVWGVAASSSGPVTVVGVDAAGAERLRADGLPIPGPDAAVLGPGLAVAVGERLDLTAASLASPRVAAVLGDGFAAALQGVVLLDAPEARSLLGLAPDVASDLAVEVFHAAEEGAIVPDLATALPRPVHITTRTDARGRAAATLARDGGLVAVMLVPGLLALTLLTASSLREGGGRRRDLGLFKTLGWTTGDLARLQLARGLAVAVPALTLGLAVAWIAVFHAGARWPAALLLDWRTPPPPLHLEPAGVGTVLWVVGGLILSPWLLAAVLPVVRGAVADPRDLLRGDRR